MESNSFALLGMGAVAARDRLADAASTPGPQERRMAAIGSTALFEEALLGALRAHLTELKLVAR